MNVHGAIFDNQTGNGIPYASIVVLDSAFNPTTAGVAADANGAFQLNSSFLDSPNANVQVSSTGYKTAVIPVNVFSADSGAGLDEGDELAAAVVVYKKRNYTWWIVGLVAFAAIMTYVSSQKKGISGLSQKEWIDIAIKLGIALGVFFVVVVPLLKKLGLWGQSPQADKNAAAVDKSIQDLQNKGGQQSIQTKSDAEITGMANQIYEFGKNDDQLGIRNTIIQVNTMADLYALIKAFGTRKVGGAFFSFCNLFSFNCPEMDLPTFVRAAAPDQINTIDSYLSQTGISYVF